MTTLFCVGGTGAIPCQRTYKVAPLPYLSLLILFSLLKAFMEGAARGYTDKKENEIFLIYKKIQMGAVSKSYMRKGFLNYEEMRKYLTKYE
jgi:hypothetical protein